MSGKKQVILILGMHRSGTSALTGFMHSLGAAVPIAENTRINPDNPKGHWEHTEVNQINDEILRQFGMTWTTPGNIDVGKVGHKHKNRLQQFLNREITGSSNEIVVFKDPRICLMLPLWLEAIQTLDCDPQIMFAVRHPEEVASSLNKRNGFSKERGLFLWLQYNLQAIRSMSGCSNLPVVSPDWLGSAAKLYQQSSELIGKEWPVSWKQVSASDFLDRKLVHNTTHPEPVTLLERASYDFFTMLQESVETNNPIDADAKIEQFVETSAGWLEAVSTVLLDERKIWREKVNSMYYLINRNSWRVNQPVSKPRLFCRVASSARQDWLRYQ